MCNQLSLPLKESSSQTRRILKFQLVSRRRVWGAEGLFVYCPVCEKAIKDAPDMHEILLTRGDFPKDMQYLIWSKYNCGLVHPECHPQAATTTNQQKLVKALVYHEGYDEVLNWLVGLEQYVKGTQVQQAVRLLESVK